MLADLATIGQPVLVATGGGEFFEQLRALAERLPDAARRMFERQRHGADPNAVTLVLERLLGS